MSQPIPVATPSAESGNAPSRRASGAAAAGDTFGATLRDQMPGTAPDASRAATSVEAASAPAAPKPAEEGLDAADADAASLEVQDLLLAPSAPPAAPLVNGPASSTLATNQAPDPAALPVSVPLLVDPSSVAQPVEAAAMQTAGDRRQLAPDAVRAGVQAAMSDARAVPGGAVGPGLADAVDPMSAAITRGESTESMLRSVDAALRPAASPAQVSLTPAAFAPLAAPSALPGHDLAPRLDPLLPPLPPVDDPQWGAALGARLVWSAAHGTHSASLALNPPELGPVNVNLTLNEDEARVSFQSHHLAVRDAIEAALPRLRELFADGGLVLGEVDISAGDGRSGAQHGAAFEQQRQQAHARAEAEDVRAATAHVRLADGLVDTFA